LVLAEALESVAALELALIEALELVEK